MAVITLKDKCADVIRVEAVLQTAYKVEWQQTVMSDCQCELLSEESLQLCCVCGKLETRSVNESCVAHA